MLLTYFKAGQGRGAGLRGDHAAETCHTPGAHVVVLRADGYQVLLRQRHLRHWRPAEYRGVREYKWLYSEQTDTRYFSDSVTFVTGDLHSTEGSESTDGSTQRRRIPGTSQTASPSSQATWRVHRVREYKWLYSELTDTRYFSDSVTFVTGDLESTQGSKRTSGTFRTASPSSETWPTFHSFQQCCGSRSGSVGSICFWASRIRIY
jgi:hypothetical protein